MCRLLLSGDFNQGERERENVRDRKAALNHIAAKKEKNRFWGEETAGFCAAGEKFLDVTRVNGSQK